jgi:serine/threonine-protein kinase RsbW
MEAKTCSVVELRIPARAEFVSVARLGVSAVATMMDFGYDVIDDIKLAVGEACTNAILHAPGPGKQESQEITIRCRLEMDSLIIEVRDSGVGCDFGDLPQQLDIDSLPETGYGLLLIEAIMDEMECMASPETGTVVRMVKHARQ